VARREAWFKLLDFFCWGVKMTAEDKQEIDMQLNSMAGDYV
jgi:hypothetical protein